MNTILFIVIIVLGVKLFVSNLEKRAYEKKIAKLQRTVKALVEQVEDESYEINITI